MYLNDMKVTKICNRTPFTIYESDITIIQKVIKDKRKNSMRPQIYQSLLTKACNINQIEVVNLLLTRTTVDVTIFDDALIIGASSNGYSQLVQLLLAYNNDNRARNVPKVNPAARENIAIRLASQDGHREVVELLLAYNSSVNRLENYPKVNPADEENYAIIQASTYGHDEVVKLLLDYNNNGNRVEHDHKVNPADNFNHAIIKASENGHHKVVKVLLDYNNSGNRSENGPKVNPADQENSAIMLAAGNGHLKVVKLLLAYNNSVNKATNDPKVNPADQENRALTLAAVNGYYEVVELLINYGVANTENFEINQSNIDLPNQTIPLVIIDTINAIERLQIFKTHQNGNNTNDINDTKNKITNLCKTIDVLIRYYSDNDMINVLTNDEVFSFIFHFIFSDVQAGVAKTEDKNTTEMFFSCFGHPKIFNHYAGVENIYFDYISKSMLYELKSNEQIVLAVSKKISNKYMLLKILDTREYLHFHMFNFKPNLKQHDISSHYSFRLLKGNPTYISKTENDRFRNFETLLG